MSAAAAAAALQAQLLRGMGLPSGSASLQSHGHNPLLNPFSPLLYPYQLAMAASAAQAAAQGRGNSSSNSNNSNNSAAAFTAASLAELQRQYLLDMLPHLPNMAAATNNSGSRSSQGQSQGHGEARSNWKSWTCRSDNLSFKTTTNKTKQQTNKQTKKWFIFFNLISFSFLQFLSPCWLLPFYTLQLSQHIIFLLL